MWFYIGFIEKREKKKKSKKKVNRVKQGVYQVLVRERFREFEVCILEVYNQFDFPFLRTQVITLSHINIFLFHFTFSIVFGCCILPNNWYQSHGEKIMRKIILKMISSLKYDIQPFNGKNNFSIQQNNIKDIFEQ